MIVVEQDVSQVLAVAQRVYCFRKGAVALDGVPGPPRRASRSPPRTSGPDAVAWLDTIVQGVLLGGLYALFATGLSLIFGVMRLVNLAHGDFSILAAFLAVVDRAGRWTSIRCSRCCSWSP